MSSHPQLLCPRRACHQALADRNLGRRRRPQASSRPNDASALHVRPLHNVTPTHSAMTCRPSTCGLLVKTRWPSTHGRSDITCRPSTHGCLGTTGATTPALHVRLPGHDTAVRRPSLAPRPAPGNPCRLSTCRCPETGPSAAVRARRDHPGSVCHRPAPIRHAIVPPLAILVLFSIVPPVDVPLHSSGRPVSCSARRWFRPSLVSFLLCWAQLTAPEHAVVDSPGPGCPRTPASRPSQRRAPHQRPLRRR